MSGHRWTAAKAPFTGAPSGGSPSSNVANPIWTYIGNFTSVDFSAAAFENTIPLYTVGSRYVVGDIFVKPTNVFGGEGIETYEIAIGIDGVVDYLGGFSDVMTAGPTVHYLYRNAEFFNYEAATDIFITARTTGVELISASGGALDVWILLSRIPVPPS